MAGHEQSYSDFCREIFNPDRHFEKPEALDDIKVLDISNYILGPYVPNYLAEFGAEVIKVEGPMGDAFRYVGRPGYITTVDAIDGKSKSGIGYLSYSHNKHHICLDLRKERGREILRNLVPKVDVLVENFRPGTFSKWGLDYRDLKKLNPGLIYAWEGGWGQWGQWSNRPSFDPVGQASSGMMSLTSGETGGPPTKAGYWLCDVAGAMHGVIGVMVALWHRKKTGEGQMIEVTQNEAGMRFLDYQFDLAGLLGKNPDPLTEGPLDWAVSPYGLVKCKDGVIWLAAIGTGPRPFETLMKAIGREDMIDKIPHQNISQTAPLDIQKKVYAAVESFTLKHSVEEVENLCIKAGLPCSRILTPWDCLNNLHYQERKTLYWFDDPYYGKHVVIQPQPRLSRTPGRVKTIAQPIGRETFEILNKYLGYTRADVQKLVDEGVSVIQ
jgi:crotonobetainyl-CoA:carnitine CoA-transferase CaiB-like acyl-CoA transferase